MQHGWYSCVCSGLTAAFHWMVLCCLVCMCEINWIPMDNPSVISQPNLYVRIHVKAGALTRKEASWAEWLHSALHLVSVKLSTNSWNTTEPSPSAYTQMIFLASQILTMMSQLSSWIIFPVVLVQKGTELNFRKAWAVKHRWKHIILVNLKHRWTGMFWDLQLIQGDCFPWGDLFRAICSPIFTSGTISSSLHLFKEIKFSRRSDKA